MQQMELLTLVVAVVAEEIITLLLQVVLELLLLDTNFKINMYLLVFKINI